MGMSAFSAALRNVAENSTTGPKMMTFVSDYSNYASLYYLMRGRKMSDTLRGGQNIRFSVKFKASSKAGFYDPAVEEHAPQDSQDSVVGRSYWHAHMAHETWKEESLLINQGGIGDGALIEQTYLQEIHNKIQSLKAALVDSLTVAFWQRPDTTIMGTLDSKQPNSIPVYLNEFTYGLFGRITAAGSYIDSNTGYTAIHGFTPADTAYAKYRPLQKTYGAGTTGFTANSADNLIYNLSYCMRKTDFVPPPFYTEAYDPEGETAVDRSGGVIFASAIGVARAEHLYRSSQNRWDDFMDPSGNPRFKTVQIVHEAQLDTAALYPNHTTLASATGFVDENTLSGGSAVTNATLGPRYYGANAKHLKVCWHQERYLKWLDPFRIGLTTWQQGVNSEVTVYCDDRSKMFLLSPNGDQ